MSTSAETPACVPFKPHMSLEEATTLKVGDEIDYRTSARGHLPALIIEVDCDGIQGMVRLQIFFRNDGEVKCSYIDHLDRFAALGSISLRQPHRLTDIKPGDLVDINAWQHPGWRKGEVTSIAVGEIVVTYGIGTLRFPTIVHLDNINAVDRFGVHTDGKNINHIPILMETKRTYLNTPNVIKSDCAKEIIDTVYGGMTNILSHLIKNAPTSELQRISKILKQKNYKYQEKIMKKNESKNEANEKETTEQVIRTKITSLSQLSSNSITNICGYLSKEDIKIFKLTSFRNGMICLRQMTQCNIAVFNSNELINDKKKKYMDKLCLVNIINVNTNYKYQRYPANMTLFALREIWEQQYGIALSKQLLLEIDSNGFWFCDTPQNDKYKTMKLESIAVNSKFVIFDKTNMIHFDEVNNAAIINGFDEFDQSKDTLLLLKWFDMFEQEITSLQFVTGKQDILTVGRLTKYIEDEFIVTTQQQKIWRAKLVSNLNRMDRMAPHHSKVIAHLEYTNVMVVANPIEKVKLFTSLTFQLDPTHPTFAKKQFYTIQEKHKLLTQ